MRMFVTVLLCMSALSTAQELPAYTEIRDLILKNITSIEDYEVDMVMSIDIPGFRMPRREVHYMYKAPDKVKIDVQGFAVVPREGIQPFMRFLTDTLMFDVIGESTLDGRPVFEISFEDTFEYSAASINLFIDAERGTVPKGVVFIEDVEMFSTETRFVEAAEGIWLPERSRVRMHFPPDFKRMQQFGKMPNEIRTLDEEIKANPEWIDGFITLEFRNYRLNRGIPDYEFEEEDEYY